MRSFDWAQSPLGPASEWPQAVQTAVGICLNSRFPMVLWLGSEFTMLYNDGWRPVLGATKHPRGLGRPGREVWPEIWDIIGAQLQSVIETGIATWSDDLLLLVDRYNYTEEAYFTYSYSPIHTDGGVSGVFSAVSETTLRVIGERRLQTLSELGALIKAKTIQEASGLSAEVLRGNDADIPFALIYLFEHKSNRASLAETVRLPPGTPASVSTIDLSAEDGWPLAEVARTQKTLTIDDLQRRFPALPGGRWPAAPATALVMPLLAAGRSQVAGMLVGGVSPCRRLDDDYRRFYELVAGHIATSIANARAYQEAQERAEILAELDRAKTAFFSNVSHEFRTPLTLLLGPVEDMLAKPGDTPLAEVRELLAVVHRSGLRLRRLVNMLLDFSRIEAGRVQASYVATDLAAFSTALASSFHSALERAALRYEVRCAPLSRPVYVDREMWEKVVLNLISNAFKYTLEGSVCVSMEERGDYVELSVADTGVGIPGEELPRIFERFHRVETTLGRTHEGTGIGLALVHELVKLHGGTVAVESTVGKGTIFTVSIPFGTAHLPADRVGARPAPASTALHADSYVEEALRWLPRDTEQPQMEPDAGLVLSHRWLARSRVLVADDNADMRDYIRQLLAGRYEVITATNGEEALEAALKNLPDLVLTDVMMPVLDGFGLLRGLRATEATKTVPVILLSARAGEESRVEGLDAGADDYLVKPFTARELLARVDAHLSLARMRRQADQARHLSDVRLALALQATNMVPWEWDPVKDEMVAGDLSSVLGTTVRSSRDSAVLVHPEDRPRHRSMVERVLREGGSWFAEFRIRRPDTGKIAWLEERATAITDAGGRVTRVVGVLTDISARKAAEEEMRRRNTELEHANSELEEFAYVASHDLQEPLRTVNIYTELLLRHLDLQDDKLANEFAGFIHKGVSQMELLIKDLLAYARVVHREQDPVAPVSLRSALEAALNTLQGRIRDSGATVSCDAVSGTVVGDERQLASVFQNLLTNALKYRREGVAPTVRITSRRVDGEWVVSVEDNGIGFQPAYAERIFGLFKRLHRDKYPGTGLGLAICRRIVERYGGRIWASSPGEGAGATFCFALKERHE